MIKISDIVVKIEKKSNLFDPIFNKLPYPVASGIVRGIRAFFGIVMPAVIVAVADGSIFTNLHIIPQGYIPLIIAVATPIVLGIDKWLREKGLEDEIKEASISVIGNGPSNDDVVADSPQDIPTP